MLSDMRKEIIKYVKNHSVYLENNRQVYDMYAGNLLPYVMASMQSSLSPEYFEKIKTRIIPINILERYIKKVAAAYNNPPTRVANSEAYQKVVDYYTDEFELNSKMRVADRYSHMFKGFALEPYFNEEPKLRVMPFDRFLVYSTDAIDPTEETAFIKMMGKVKCKDLAMRDLYYTYTDFEIDAFTEDGETYSPALEGNEGINLYGEIPFVYGNRSENELLPIQDTDILTMSKIPSILLSDLSGCILFQCFSIIYGIDLDMENIVMSPNALWSFKSDKDSDKKPEVGTIKPSADIDQVMKFIVSTFVMWMESKGIRVGSIGNIDAGNAASGISKVIDEADVFLVVKESMSNFVEDELELWEKMVSIHNYWVDTGQVINLPKLGDDFEIEITFPDPKPFQDRAAMIAEKVVEVNAGFKSKRKAIIELNPNMTEEELQEELDLIEEEGKEGVDVSKGADVEDATDLETPVTAIPKPQEVKTKEVENAFNDKV